MPKNVNSSLLYSHPWILVLRYPRVSTGIIYSRTRLNIFGLLLRFRTVARTVFKFLNVIISLVKRWFFKISVSWRKSWLIILLIYIPLIPSWIEQIVINRQSIALKFYILHLFFKSKPTFILNTLRRLCFDYRHFLSFLLSYINFLIIPHLPWNKHWKISTRKILNLYFFQRRPSFYHFIRLINIQINFVLTSLIEFYFRRKTTVRKLRLPPWKYFLAPTNTCTESMIGR